MGCDIHMFAEVRKSEKWEAVGKVFKNKYYEPDRENKIDEDGFEWNPEFTSSPYTNRNYNLFAILADVRNGRGFAGIKTGEGFNPIASPKGLPKDISNEILMIESCTVGEDYTIETLKKWVERGDSEWIIENQICTSPDAHSASYFTLKEILDFDWRQKTKFEDDVKLYSYSECVGNFLTETIPTLQKLGNDEDVRIVFWFDN